MNVTEFKFIVQTEKRNIDFLNKIFEAYDHLCVVSTVNAEEGILKIWGYGKPGPVRRVLKGLPFRCIVISEELETIE